MARIPGIDSAFSLLQAQTEALHALPAAVNALSGAVRGLVEVAAQARDTVATVNRLATRLDGLVQELEEPLKALAPGLTRLAAALDDPVVDDLPETVRKVQEDLLPVLRTVADTHERVAFIAGSTERILGFVDETSRTFAGLPGAGLLGRRWPPGRVVPGSAGPAGTGPRGTGAGGPGAGGTGARSTSAGETVRDGTVQGETVQGEVVPPDA